MQPAVERPQLTATRKAPSKASNKSLAAATAYGEAVVRVMNVPDTCALSQVGCGNSNLQEGMVQAGYHVVNVSTQQQGGGHSRLAQPTDEVTDVLS
jgi:hypothetical protein